MKRESSGSFGEFFELLWIRLKTSWTNLVEYLRVFLHYYLHSFSFMRLDSYLLGSYLFNSPFTVSKRFLEKRGEEDIYAYGETPLTTMELIAKECRITEKDTVFELGCGRGRTCFWMNHFLKCKVVGIEYIPEFVERANKVKKKFAVNHVEFRLEDMLKTDLKDATVIYLYGTCLQDDFIHQLVERISKVPAGTKVITVSYPLSDYGDVQKFEVMKRFPARFTWGTTDVYLQVKK